MGFMGLAGPTRAALTTEQTLAEGTLGSETAPVTIIEFASLTCPHCAAFEADSFPPLKAKYIDTGKVRFIFRDFPLDQAALKAAVVARCAGPERYFGFLAAFFRSQETWASAPDPMAELAKIARLGGLGKAEFDACLNDKALLDGVLKSRLEGEEKYKVKATPTFIVNGVKHEGNIRPAEFDQILEPLLGQATTATPVPGATAPAAPAPAMSAPAAGPATPAPATPQPGYFEPLWQRLKAYFK